MKRIHVIKYLAIVSGLLVANSNAFSIRTASSLRRQAIAAPSHAFRPTLTRLSPRLSSKLNIKKNGNDEVSRKLTRNMNISPILLKRIQQGARIRQSKDVSLAAWDELTVEERIAALMKDARKVAVNKRTYESTRDKLRDCRLRAEERLSRSMDDKKVAAEKISKTEAKMQAEIGVVEDQLGFKLKETQVSIDEEVARIKDVLNVGYTLEVERIDIINRLLRLTEDMIAAKEAEISNDQQIANEMIDIQSKEKDGAIAKDMDRLINQKLDGAEIEQELVDDLFECRAFLQNRMADARYRVAYTKQALEGLARERPDSRSFEPYSWADIDDMELVLEQAADNVDGAAERIRMLSRRINIALVKRAIILEEEVPVGLSKGGQRGIRNLLSSPAVDLDINDFLKMGDSDRKEFFTRLTESGSKAAADGFKSLLDEATKNPSEDSSKRTPRFGQGKSDALVENKNLMLEERIAALVAEARGLCVSRRVYVSARKDLIESRTKTQNRMSRCDDDKEIAAEKIANIKATREPEIRTAEDRLESSLYESQVKINEEVARMLDLLDSEYELEMETTDYMETLISFLKDLIADKEGDVFNARQVADEMMDVRSKQKDGAIAANLDKLADQKLKAADIDKDLVNTLTRCLDELQRLLEGSRDRASRTSQTLDGLAQDRPDAWSSQRYDWTGVEGIERMVTKASSDVASAETRIRRLSKEVDEALVDRSIVLGENVPRGLTKVAQRVASRSLRKAMSSSDVDVDFDIEDLMEKDGKELFSMLTRSIIDAAADVVDGANRNKVRPTDSKPNVASRPTARNSKPNIASRPTARNTASSPNKVSARDPRANLTRKESSNIADRNKAGSRPNIAARTATRNTASSPNSARDPRAKLTRKEPSENANQNKMRGRFGDSSSTAPSRDSTQNKTRGRFGDSSATAPSRDSTQNKQMQRNSSTSTPKGVGQGDVAKKAEEAAKKAKEGFRSSIENATAFGSKFFDSAKDRIKNAGKSDKNKK